MYKIGLRILTTFTLVEEIQKLVSPNPNGVILLRLTITAVMGVLHFVVNTSRLVLIQPINMRDLKVHQLMKQKNSEGKFQVVGANLQHVMEMFQFNSCQSQILKIPRQPNPKMRKVFLRIMKQSSLRNQKIRRKCKQYDTANLKNNQYKLHFQQ